MTTRNSPSLLSLLTEVVSFPGAHFLMYARTPLSHGIGVVKHHQYRGMSPLSNYFNSTTNVHCKGHLSLQVMAAHARLFYATIFAVAKFSNSKTSTTFSTILVFCLYTIFSCLRLADYSLLQLLYISVASVQPFSHTRSTRSSRVRPQWFKLTSS